MLKALSKNFRKLKIDSSFQWTLSVKYRSSITIVNSSWPRLSRPT